MTRLEKLRQTPAEEIAAWLLQMECICDDRCVSLGADGEEIYPERDLCIDCIVEWLNGAYEDGDI